MMRVHIQHIFREKLIKLSTAASTSCDPVAANPDVTPLLHRMSEASSLLQWILVFIIFNILIEKLAFFILCHAI